MRKRKIENPQTISQKELFSRLDSSEGGLSLKKSQLNTQKYGFNELTEKKKRPYLKTFLNQFKSLFIYILLVAALISFLIKNFIDVYIILGIICINTAIGFFQERKAEKAIESLKKRVVSYAKVFRDNTLIKINSRELVPGDIILLEQGDKIPADARLLSIKNFKTIEASLTGESTPVEKIIALLPKKTLLAERKNMIFLGTFVASGTAKAIVVSTGDYTEIGQIAKSIQKIKTRRTHFQEKINKLSIKMTLIALTGAFLTFLIGFFIRKMAFTEMFLFSIASLVSGIPEGLPAVLTIVLAIGALRMARKKAVTRNLPSTETLGIVDTIITDKTGTITKNIMTVRKIFLASGKEIQVTGNEWQKKGAFYFENKRILPTSNKSLNKLLEMAYLCSSAKIQSIKKTTEIIGDPTEAALLIAAEKAEIIESSKKRYSIIDEIPFDQESKYKASIFEFSKQKSKKEIAIIGAPEQILEKTSNFYIEGEKQKITEKNKKDFLIKTNELAKEGMRILAVAFKEDIGFKENINNKEIQNLTFLGLIAISDPPRPEVKEAISRAKEAGIRVIMVTGDHKETAVAISKEIGLIPNSSTEKKIAMSEQELEKLSQKEFRKAVSKINVFARLTPKMKLKIAITLQKQGRKIAMTGDGVNDAPALKQADIGISMGLIGTDVARDSSEIILSDDNFATIINAVEQGRIVFNNVRNTSFFLITTNVAEDVTIISTLLLGMPLPLLPTQILWLNLVTDTGPGLGLAAEPGEKDILNHPPKSSKEEILNCSILPYLFIMGGLMTLLTIFIFSSFYAGGIEKARTGAFVMMAMTQIFNSLNMRSLKQSVFKLGFLRNKTLILFIVISILFSIGVVYLPFLQQMFDFVSLSIKELLFIFILSSTVFLGGEFYKFIKKKKKINHV